MTSTADLPRAGVPSWVRTALVLAVLAWLAAQATVPWGWLWLLVPLAAAVTLLGAWRFGGWALVIPVVLAVGAGAMFAPSDLWVWWIPACALSGAWMGLHEEGGPSPGRRAWMLLPVLLLAVVMPWLPGYADLVRRVDQDLQAGDRQFLDFMREIGRPGSDTTLRHLIEENGALRSRGLAHALPSVLFLWMAMLIAAGRTLAARAAATLRWPAMSRSPLRTWRLPDGALWLFLAGLGVLVAQWRTASPAGWTLLVNSGLGFCIQGIAVVESLLLARGVPPSIIVVTMVFVFTLAMPVFMLTTVAVGLSDVWLDYRRIEAPPDSEPS